MPSPVPYRIRLPPPIRINQLRHHQIAIAHAVRVRHRQRVPLHRLDRAPHVDDLHAAFEQLRRFGGQVVRHARQRRAVRLVDVDALDGAAQTQTVVRGFCARRRAPDRVVEDEDAGGAGAARLVRVTGRLGSCIYLGRRTA